jgi:hypothetical protein
MLLHVEFCTWEVMFLLTPRYKTPRGFCVILHDSDVTCVGFLGDLPHKVLVFKEELYLIFAHKHLFSEGESLSAISVMSLHVKFSYCLEVNVV